MPIVSPRSEPRRKALAGLLGAWAVLAACSQQSQQATTMEVVATRPAGAARATQPLGTRSQPIPLHLNAEITVEFSEDVDHLTVNSDTVRLMKVGGGGQDHVVDIPRGKPGARSVTLIPDWPVTAALDDGSLVPEQLYRLEVHGFPKTNTVKSRSGRPVSGFVRYYRTVGVDSRDPGPMLPPGLPDDPFSIVPGFLRMAANARTVRLHFTLPPDPQTVRPESFEFFVLRGGEKVRLPIESTRILTDLRHVYEEAIGANRRVRMSYPASTVEIRLDDAVQLRAGQDFWVHAKPPARKRADGSLDTDHWLRDYRGNPVSFLNESFRYVQGRVSGGERIELLRFPASAGPRPQLLAEDAKGMGFEVHQELRRRVVRPLARKGVGRGTHGAFRPTRSMVLEPFVPFDPGDGMARSAAGRFEFTSIHIPKGVTVTIRSRNHGVELLATGGVRIDGKLVLATRDALAPEGIDLQDVETYRGRLLHENFGFRLAAARDIEIRGEIEARQSGDYKQSPMSLIARRLLLDGGKVPPGSLVSAEVSGPIQGVTLLHKPLAAGLPEGRDRAQAEGWTDWMPLPKDFQGPIQARVVGARGRVDVFVQIAPPDPADSSLPYTASGTLVEPRRLPLRADWEVARGSFVRFRFVARVLRGKALPSVQAVVIVAAR